MDHGYLDGNGRYGCVARADPRVRIAQYGLRCLPGCTADVHVCAIITVRGGVARIGRAHVYGRACRRGK
jgi:hypothetical protein